MKEKDLIENLRNPQLRERTFESLVRLYQKNLYWHIGRIVQDHDDADDVLQNTFIKAWQNIHKFRGDSKIRTWLYRIATNESLTFINKRKRRMHAGLENIEDYLAHSESQNAYMDGEEIRDKLQAAVATLPEKQRVVFNLKYYEEMKYTEIVDILGGTVGSLKASFHHAVKKIEKLVTDD